jgi:hypothetical protein
MLLKPCIDGGIMLDGSVEAEQFGFHASSSENADSFSRFACHGQVIIDGYRR